jgi:predicted enzyme related to lactoylglutathione lyase
MNFNSILIGSEDPQRLVAYYTAVLGAPAFEGEGYASWTIGTGTVSVGPHSEVTGKSAQPGRVIWNIESEDVKGDAERFKAAGAIVVAEPYLFEMEEAPPEFTAQPWIATFADPDDNYFQLVSPMSA